MAEHRRTTRPAAFADGYALAQSGGTLPEGISFTLAPHFVNGYNHGRAHSHA